MCQPKSSGGRRCPIHRHDSSSAIKHAVNTSLLSRKQVEDVFTELRREGRSLGRGNAAQQEWYSYKSRMADTSQESFEGDEHPPAKSTLYALQHLQERAERRGASLESALRRIARSQHARYGDVKRSYEEVLRTTTVTRSSVPSSYTEDAVIHAQSKNLPSDPASIEAMSKVTNPKCGGENLHTTSKVNPDAGVVVQEYDEERGVLRVTVGGASLSYKDVPRSVVDEVSKSQDISLIRSNPQYLMDSAEEDGVIHSVSRCPSCGQFMGDKHSCPAAEKSDSLSASDVSKPASEVQTLRLKDCVKRNVQPEITAMVKLVKYNHTVASDGLQRLEEFPESRLVEMYNLLDKARKIHATTFTPNSVDFQGLVKDSNIEVPVKILFNNYRMDCEVEGTAIVEQNASLKYHDDVHIMHQELKCTCTKYLKNRDCPHVRLASNYIPYTVPLQEPVSSYKRFACADVVDRNNDFFFTESIVQASGGSPEERDKLRRERLEAQRRESESEDKTYALMRKNSAIATSRTQRLLRNSDYEERESQFARYRERLLHNYDSAAPLYARSPQSFYDDYQSLSREELPYRYHNALGASGESRSFGVELEFMVGEKDKSHAQEVLKRVAHDLHGAGLSDSNTVNDYHDSQIAGWKSWSLELDVSVDGEIVSPIMSDTEENWKNLHQVCGILQKHGCRATAKTGSHVHVSSGSYGFSTAKQFELRRLAEKDEDTLYRLSMNPSSSEHRGISYCSPNIADGQDGIPASMNYGLYNMGDEHHAALSFEASADPDNVLNSHVEFRTWDGTLDPSVIQRQIQVSTGLTDYAEYRVMRNGASRRPKRSTRLGTHYSETAGKGISSPESLWESHKDVAQFLDQTFPDTRVRKDVMHLFAKTRWF